MYGKHELKLFSIKLPIDHVNGIECFLLFESNFSEIKNVIQSMREHFAIEINEIIAAIL